MDVENDIRLVEFRQLKKEIRGSERHLKGVETNSIFTNKNVMLN
jgi:hypothetical protein